MGTLVVVGLTIVIWEILKKFAYPKIDKFLKKYV